MPAMPATHSAVFHFEGTVIGIIDSNGGRWITAGNLSQALGYADIRAVSRIYRRHADEFSDAMTVVVNLTTTGPVPTEHRIFSPRGAHLIAMLSKAPKAKTFRRWVLDVLERELSDRRPERPELLAMMADLARLRTEADALERRLIAAAPPDLAALGPPRMPTHNQPGLTPEQRAEAVALRAAGYSPEQLARRYKVTAMTICKWLRRDTLSNRER